MDGMYGLHPAPAEYSNRSPDNLIAPSDLHSVMINPPYFHHDRLPAPEQVFFGSVEAGSISQKMRTDDGGGVSSTIKSQIASHPRYPSLLQAYIDCHKVGAPPEIAWLLDEMRRENEKDDVVSSFIGDDPELDEFMETYCDILVKCKSDLSRPFDEATAFLNKIESHLSCLCNPSFATTASDDGAISSDEEYSVGDQADTQGLQHKDEERDLKDRLLRRFGSHIGSLKMEFCKKKKKGKLPREAKQTLLEWWNSHCKWPYPTEDDKITLAETTGLDQRQINNWFINQRKRHWKPSENMQFALMH